MSQHFVILTEQRSGSTMLVHILREHPAVRCFGELLRKTPKWMLLKGYKGQLRILEELDPKWRKDRHRLAHPEAFRDVAYATDPGYDWYGFKLHLDQHDGYLARAVARPEERLILLRRENLLAQFSSELIAKATGQGSANTSNADGVKKARVPFRPGDFDKHVRQSNKRWDGLQRAIRDAGRDSVYLTYLDATAGDGVSRTLDYLGLDPVAGLSSNTVKRNPSRIVDRFTNADAVLAHLDKIGRPEWAEEGDAPAPSAADASAPVGHA
ncbi:MAG: sulfotransferase [Planctomycetota bacterium]